jgi:hypothetical protein
MCLCCDGLRCPEVALIGNSGDILSMLWIVLTSSLPFHLRPIGSRPYMARIDGGTHPGCL